MNKKPANKVNKAEPKEHVEQGLTVDEIEQMFDVNLNKSKEITAESIISDFIGEHKAKPNTIEFIKIHDAQLRHAVSLACEILGKVCELLPKDAYMTGTIDFNRKEVVRQYDLLAFQSKRI